MKQVSIEKILAVFVVLFLLSRTGTILKWFSEQNGGELFTLQPLLDQPAEGRYVVTLLVMALGFVIVWKLLLHKK